MNESFFDLEKIKEIYKKYPEIEKKEKKLEDIRETAIEESTEKELSQIKELVINKNTLTSQTKDQDDEEIIDYLFNLVERKGIVAAIETVKKINNPFILDKFHDELIKRETLNQIKEG